MPFFYTILILLAVITAIAVMTAAYARIRIRILRNELQRIKKSDSENNVFTNLFSKNIRNFNDTKTWMNVTARHIADAVDAVGLCIYLLDKDGVTLRLAGSAGRIPQSLHGVHILSPEGSAQDPEDGHRIHNMLEAVIYDREEILVESRQDIYLLEVDTDPYYPVRAFMAAPLTADGAVIGALCAVNRLKREALPFDRDLFRRMKFMSSHVVLARNIMEVYSNLSEQQRISQELQFAQGLQKSLLPQDMPDWGQFQIDAISRSSKEVSGDFYDYVEIDKDRLLVVIGDACGKGIPACMIMAMTRSFIRSNASRFTTLREMIMELNSNLNHDMGDGRYITLGACLINRKESTIEYMRAGHTELLIYVRDHIRSIYPEGAGLGLLPTDMAEFDVFCIEMTPGMEVMLFTDGINEATNPAGEYFGVERIKEIFVKSCNEHDEPRDSIARVMGSVDEFSQNPTSQADDQTVVIIRHV
ncbi:MAG: SpoIIE family protein phosphatase [Lentisphaeria bacterium]|nr:SpoIIE family protein phosphatase [Lentisphaeria bacterium]